MKRLKITFCVLLVFCITFSFIGCSISKKINVGKDGKINVDKDGNIKIKSEEGDLEIGKAKWDKSKMYGLDSPKAKLESYIGTDENAMYGFSGMKEKDAEEYINKIKEAGFTYNIVVMEDYNFTGTNKEGKVVSFSYNKSNGEGLITTGQGDIPSEDDKGVEAIIGGEDKEWHSDKVGGVPDPGVPILTYWSIDGDTSYTFEKIEDHLGYVEKIKSCGFTIDPSVAEIDDLYIYTASNSNGDSISFSSSSDSGTLSFTQHK